MNCQSLHKCKEAPMRHIPLSQDRFALVDDEDYERFMPFKWFYKPEQRGHKRTAMRHVTSPDGTKTTEYLSRAIMPAPAGQRVIFINRNRLDCRKENLR